MLQAYLKPIMAIAALIALGAAVALQLRPHHPTLADVSGIARAVSIDRWPAGTSCSPTTIAEVPAPLRSAKIEKCAEAEVQRHRDSESFQLAEAQALAANAQAISAFDQTQIALWAGIVGTMTLAAAVAAAIYAERAAFHAKQNSQSYRDREKAILHPAVHGQGARLDAYVENVGPTPATIHLLNSMLLPALPPGPLPWPFPAGSQGFDARSIKPEVQAQFGNFAIPSDWPRAYFVGGVIYETIFGEVELLACVWEFDRQKNTNKPLWSGDWSEWERRTEELRKVRKRY